MSSVTCPVFAVAGSRDIVASEQAAREIVDLVSSADVTFEVAPGGHLGVVAGASAPERTWRPVADWLQGRS